MHAIDRLVEIMARLRSPDGGCPWDLEQDFRSIAPHTIEEAYEVADAIERDDFDGLREELGDLLLQVVFHAQMAREEGRFGLEDVAGSITGKLVSRHPHVFGDAEVATAADQSRAWDEHKAAERAAHAAARGEPAAASALDGVTRGLPALLRAAKLQRRAARAGFDWRGADEILAKLREEVDEVAAELATGRAERLGEEIGDVLFVAANLAREAGGDPEELLRRANDRFGRRFRAMEAELTARQQGFGDCSPEEQLDLWRQAKRTTGT